MPCRRLVKLLLASAQLVYLSFGEAIAEQVGDDFGIPPPERRRKLRPREWPVQFSAEGHPCLEVQLRGVHEGAVHVPESGVFVGSGHSFPCCIIMIRADRSISS